MNMKKYIFFFLLMLSVPLTIVAQTPEPVQAEGRVTIYNKDSGKDIFERVYYTEMLSKKDAYEAYEAFKRLSGGNNNDYTIDDKVKLLKRKYRFLNKTKGNGKFEISNAVTTFYVLFLTDTEAEVSEPVEIVKGKEYNIKIEVSRLEDKVKVTGKGKRPPKIGGGSGDPGDGNEYFRIQLDVVKGNARNNARLIIQTFAVDCLTDDTVAYCMPLVYEGSDYHQLQDKRMAFNFFENDSLSKGYQASTPLEDGEEINIDTTLVFKKPDKNASYRGPFRYVLEDYHHVYVEDGWGGTCLHERPFKFLDFTPALADMELTEEFKEQARMSTVKENRSLALNFVTGTAALKDDSLNFAILGKITDELRSYGDKLISADIQGMASPDGNMKKNQELAQQRAQKAASLIRGALPSNRNVTTSSDVYKWSDVVAKLKQSGKEDYANRVDSIVKKNELPDRELRQLEFYESDVIPILDGMRVMKASFQYLRDKILTPDEAVEEFRKRRNTYKFFNYDFWNIYDNLTDSAEIDTLTVFAYKYITRDPDYAVENLIAPYICNKMALLKIKNGTPDPEILKPFIDLSRGSINARKPVDDMTTIIVNRREMLLNQAIAYYQQLKMDSCKYFIEWLNRQNASTPGLKSLERIMNLKSLHYNNFRSASEEQEYESAKNYVLGISDENKAILYSEIPDWGKPQDAMKYVNLLPDDMAKKWYLKGILWAQTAWKELAQLFKRTPGMEIKAETSIREQLEPQEEEDNSDKPDLGGGFFLLTEDEEADLMAKDYSRYALYNQQKEKYMAEHDGQLPKVEVKVKPKNPDDDIEVEGFPFYLAYFQHCFDLEPQFKRLYFAEAHVPEDLRKLYQYKKKNIPAYRKLFRLLQEYELRKEQEELDKLSNPEGDKKEDADEKKTTADTAAM